MFFFRWLQPAACPASTVAAGSTIMKLLVFTMYFSGGMIPLYLVVKGVGLYGSRWALGILRLRLVDTYNLITMRTAFAGVPDSLEESAKLDGANAWTRSCGVSWPRW